MNGRKTRNNEMVNLVRQLPLLQVHIPLRTPLTMLRSIGSVRDRPKSQTCIQRAHHHHMVISAFGPQCLLLAGVDSLSRR
jgi:hypothetical protein